MLEKYVNYNFKMILLKKIKIIGVIVIDILV